MEYGFNGVLGLVLLAADDSKKASSFESIVNAVGTGMYVVLALVALWGAYCVVMAWRRVAQKRFKSEDQQRAFLDALAVPLAHGDFDAAVQVCEGDQRAMCQLANISLINRNLGLEKSRQIAIDRFQRDVLADLDHRLAWVNTVIKTAPMIGLLGTVMGMMGAFGKLATADTVDPAEMAGNIQLALITTACGLSIAIPLVLCIASISVRIRKLEDLVEAGLGQFFEIFKMALARHPGK